MKGEIPSLSHPKTTQKILSLLGDEDFSGKRILDLGAGPGYLSWKLSEWLDKRGQPTEQILVPCDLFPQHFEYDRLHCVEADFNGPLPFDDASFDVVVSMEVIEHLPDQLRFMNEIARILKPGGRAIITTPNVLNAPSRLRYLIAGTMPLFDIMPISQRDVTLTTGHISPVSLYYLYYYAKLAGFRETRFHIDRVKKIALLQAPVIFAVAKIAGFFRDLRRRRWPYWAENEAAARQVNRWQTLVGRTIILDAVR